MGNRTDNIDVSRIKRIQAGCAIVTSVTSRFYTKDEQITQQIQPDIDRALKSGPVKEIEVLNVRSEKLTPDQMRRFKCRKILRGDWAKMDTELRSIRFKRRPLTDKEVGFVFYRYKKLLSQFGTLTKMREYISDQQKKRKDGYRRFAYGQG